MGVRTAIVTVFLSLPPPPAEDLSLELVQGDTVMINCPQRVDLQVLIDYVGTILDVRFLYGEELKGQEVDLRPSPIAVPKPELLKLLANVLSVRDLALVEDGDGFYRIVQTAAAPRKVDALLPPGSRPSAESFRLVTHVFTVPANKVQTLADKLGQFLTSAKSGMLALPEEGLLIVTDYEFRIRLIQDLLAALETRAAPIETKTVLLTTGDPVAIATQVSAISTDAHRLQKRAGDAIIVRGDIVDSAIVLIGTQDQIDETTTLLSDLTPPQAQMTTATYEPRYMSVNRLHTLIQHALVVRGSQVAAPAHMYPDLAGGKLYVTASAATHEAITRLLEDQDDPLPEPERPLRIYQPKHRKASELMGTLSLLLSEGAEITYGSALEEEPQGDGGPPGRNRPPARPGQVPPAPPEPQQPRDEQTAPRRPTSVRGPEYVLTEDEHTNSILAIGSREFHAQLQILIEDLDHRRPQVLIEMTLVAMTMSDSLDLGVELSKIEFNGDAWDFLIFSNFGLSSIDVDTGQRTLTPGSGGNGIVLRPEKFSAIIRALSTDGHARVISTPKLLVSDNARGVLRNVDEAPFTSVNASDTVATTSFAGFESAGTTLSVTPHISEGNHLTLEFELSFSNFTGSSSEASVPPPRTTNSFSSIVEVPNGHTVVTGGLVVRNNSDSRSKIPLLGDIPILGHLFGTMTTQNSLTKVFAFIRPTILRDDDFEQLKFITLKDTETAELVDDHSFSETGAWME